jgi:tetratricopeptide (TPR) repeat protein
VEREPGQAKARLSLGSIYYNRGNLFNGQRKWVEAQTEYGKALDIHNHLVAEFPAVPDYRHELSKVLHNLGNLLWNTGKRVEAEKLYRRSVDLDNRLVADFPAVPDYRKGLAISSLSLGILLRDTGRGAQAVDAFSRAIDHDKRLAIDFPAVPEYRQNLCYLHFHRARLFQSEGQFAEAIADYREVIKLNPMHTGAHSLLGMCLATAPDPRLRDPKLAVASAKKAIELAPADPSPWNTLGMAYYASGAYQAAIGAIHRSIKLGGHADSTDYFFLAMAHRRLGHKDTAGGYYQKGVRWMDKNRPTDPELRRFRAEAAALLGITDEPKAPGKDNPAP